MAGFVIEGVEDALKKMDEMTKNVAKKHVKKALRAAAKPVLQSAKDNAKKIDDPDTAANIAKNLGLEKQFYDVLDKFNTIRNRYSHRRQYLLEESSLDSLCKSIDMLPPTEKILACQKFSIFISGTNTSTGEKVQQEYQYKEADLNKNDGWRGTRITTRAQRPSRWRLRCLRVPRRAQLPSTCRCPRPLPARLPGRYVRGHVRPSFPSDCGRGRRRF